MTDQRDYGDDYEDEIEADDFDDDNLAYESSYSEFAPQNLWTPILAASLLLVILALGFGWYSLNSDLAALAARVAALPKLPPGLVEHEHPRNDDIMRLESQLQEMAELLRLQEELLAAFREPTEPAAAGPAPMGESDEITAMAPVEQAPAAGKWLINLGSFRQPERAATWAESLTADGYPIEVAEALSGGAPIYRVRVAGLPDRKEAGRIVDILENKHDLRGIWITRNHSE